MIITNPYSFHQQLGGGGEDPSFSNVTLLCHMDGADQSSNFIDQKGSIITSSGSPVISAEKPKFGSGSLKISNDNQRVTVQSKQAVGAFTWEAFICFQSIPLDTVYFLSFTSGVKASFTGTANAGRVIIGFDFSNLSIYSQDRVPTGAYHHIAACRNESGQISLFLDGVFQGSGANSQNITSSQIEISGNSGSIGPQPSNMLFDEIRLTSGVCRYSENFIPPDAPFPDN